MLTLLTRLGDGLKALAGLVFPMFVRARGLGRVGPILRRALHVLAVVAILVVLGVLNRVLNLDQYLRAPAPLAGLRVVWLPLLFLLFYLVCWLGWFLWKLLGPDHDTSDFPDIDQAWEEAKAALDQAGLDLTESPLFLLLGRPAGGEKALFQASQLELQVRQAPRRPDSPLHVFANRDGIYLTCAGASLLGRQAALLGGELGGLPARATPEPAEADDESAPESAFVSAADLPVRDAAPAASEAPAAARPRAVNWLDPAADESAGQILVADEESAPAPRPGHAARPQLLRDADEVERQTGRLRHLCRLVARDRRPFCPVNGVVLLIPLAATDGDAEAKETASICQRDLVAAREALQVHCPTFVIVCDLEQAPGFDEFLRAIPEAQRRRLPGQQFPLLPDLDAPARLRMIERGMQWVGNDLFPSLVYRLWRMESGEDGPAEAVAGNVRLYRFLQQVRDRQRRVIRILTRGVALQARGPLMLGGCYFAGTGRDAARDQGFVAGIFRHLVANQNYVSWTPDALDEEADYGRWTRYGYLALIALVLAITVALAVLNLTPR